MPTRPHPTWATIVTCFSPDQNWRKDVRHTIHFRTKLEQAQGPTERALIQNISRSGIRFMTNSGLKAGDVVSVQLMDGAIVYGTIVRQCDIEFGLEFRERLSKATLSAMRLASLPLDKTVGSESSSEGQAIRALDTSTTFSINKMNLSSLASLWHSMRAWFIAVKSNIYDSY